MRQEVFNMKPIPEVPQQLSEVPRRAEHEARRGQQRRAGERSGHGAEGLRPYLEQERRDRGVPSGLGRAL